MSQDIRHDFIGQEINVDDRVISYQSGYTGLKWGKVVSFTPKMVRVSFDKDYLSSTLRPADGLVVVSEEQEQALAFARMGGLTGT